MKQKLIVGLAVLGLVCLFALPAVAADGPNQKFTCDMKTYVPFDATTTVTVECPDPAAAKWLGSHLAEWFGAYAPKVKAAATGAAATALVVNTAAAAHGASATMSATSLRPLYLICAGTPAARNPLAAQTPPTTLLIRLDIVNPPT